MKKLLTILTFVLFSFTTFAQVDGISYQAVIIDNNADEIPGVDVSANNLPNTPVEVKFTITGNSGIEYQETHSTSTDDFGMLNLMIGQGQITGASPSSFNQIYWDGNKDLQVEIDLNSGDGFVVFSNQELTYIPYVKHREIVATSTLDVDGETNLNSNLTVNNQSPTLLTGDLTVEGLVAFDGGLDVGGDAQFYSDLTVDGITNLNDNLYVNNGATATLSGDLIVQGQSTFDDGVFENLTVNQTTNLIGSLDVGGVSSLNGQVIIDANMNSVGGDLYSAAHPLRVMGSRQGISIELTGLSSGTPNNNNNFISFNNANNIRYGRIEGETSGEHANTFMFIWNASNVALEYVFQVAMVAFDIIGVDDFDVAVVEGFEMVNIIANWEAINIYNLSNVGVSFSSGFGDYAEWLEKEDISEKFSYGDIVGVIGGKISKKTQHANHYMVISQNPIVLGNMQQENREKDFEKVAFMGQVPVKVLGKVNIGDYIVPSNFNDGIGRAISPKKINIADYEKIIGVAWSESKTEGVSLVNLAVGINTNDTSEILQSQQDEINTIKGQLNTIIAYLKSTDKSFKVEEFNIDNSEKKSSVLSDIETINISSKKDASYESPINSGFTVKDSNKYKKILQLLNDNPEVISDIMANARELLDSRGIDYTLYDQTKRLLSDEKYFLNHLKEMISE